MGNTLPTDNTEINDENIEIKNNLLRNLQDFLKDFLDKNSLEIYDNIDNFDFNQYSKPYIFYKYFPTINYSNYILLSNYSYTYSMDVLCAIYCTTELEIGIKIDNKIVCRQKIPANSYFLPLCGPLFICSLNFWPDIKILSKEHGKIHFVYCFFNEKLMKFTKNNILYSSFFNNEEVKDILYKEGHFYIGKEATELIKKLKENKENMIKIPEFYLNTENYTKYLANKVSNDIREELLEIAMNPNRLESFMSIDEIKIYLKK
jgi:hypothetical protein